MTSFFGQTFVTGPDKQTHSCHCVGPQNGQPLCPCAMRAVKIVNGRYVMPERDLGPADVVTRWRQSSPERERLFQAEANRLEGEISERLAGGASNANSESPPPSTTDTSKAAP